MSKINDNIVVTDNRIQSSCSRECGECRQCTDSYWFNGHYWAEVERFREMLEDERDPEPWWSCQDDCGECGYCKRGVAPELG